MIRPPASLAFARDDRIEERSRDRPGTEALRQVIAGHMCTTRVRMCRSAERAPTLLRLPSHPEAIRPADAPGVEQGAGASRAPIDVDIGRDAMPERTVDLPEIVGEHEQTDTVGNRVVNAELQPAAPGPRFVHRVARRPGPK